MFEVGKWKGSRAKCLFQLIPLSFFGFPDLSIVHQTFGVKAMDEAFFLQLNVYNKN
jgi:hypothetical protein